MRESLSENTRTQSGATWYVVQKVDRKDGIESPSSVNKGQRWIRTINSLSSKTSTERKAVSGLLKLNREAVDETNPGSAGVWLLATVILFFTFYISSRQLNIHVVQSSAHSPVHPRCITNIFALPLLLVFWLNTLHWLASIPCTGWPQSSSSIIR